MRSRGKPEIKPHRNLPDAVANKETPVIYRASETFIKTKANSSNKLGQIQIIRSNLTLSAGKSGEEKRRHILHGPHSPDTRSRNGGTDKGKNPLIVLLRTESKDIKVRITKLDAINVYIFNELTKFLCIDPVVGRPRPGGHLPAPPVLLRQGFVLRRDENVLVEDMLAVKKHPERREKRRKKPERSTRIIHRTNVRNRPGQTIGPGYLESKQPPVKRIENVGTNHIIGINRTVLEEIQIRIHQPLTAVRTLKFLLLQPAERQIMLRRQHGNKLLRLREGRCDVLLGRQRGSETDTESRRLRIRLHGRTLRTESKEKKLPMAQKAPALEMAVIAIGQITAGIDATITVIREHVLTMDHRPSRKHLECRYESIDDDIVILLGKRISTRQGNLPAERHIAALRNDHTVDYVHNGK